MAPSHAAAGLLARMQQLPDISIHQPLVGETQFNAQQQHNHNATRRLNSLVTENNQRQQCIQTYNDIASVLQLLLDSDSRNTALQATNQDLKKQLAARPTLHAHQTLQKRYQTLQDLILEERGEAQDILLRHEEKADEMEAVYLDGIAQLEGFLSQEWLLRGNLEKQIVQARNANLLCQSEIRLRERQIEADTADYVAEVESHKATKARLESALLDAARLNGHLNEVKEPETLEDLTKILPNVGASLEARLFYIESLRKRYGSSEGGANYSEQKQFSFAAEIRSLNGLFKQHEKEEASLERRH